MKKVYYKPEMTVVAVNQQQALLNSSSGSGPNSEFMDNPTISGGAGVRQESYNVWDDVGGQFSIN